MSTAELNQGTLDAAIEISARRSDTLRLLIDAVLKAKSLELASVYARQLRGDAAKTPLPRLVENQGAPLTRRRTRLTLAKR